MPEAVSLLRYAPDGQPGPAGKLCSMEQCLCCTNILKAAATGEDPDQIKFSPSYLYNQIRLDGCQGSYLQRAMEAMQKNGGVPLSQYPYNDQDCEREPGLADVQAGRQNKFMDLPGLPMEII